MKDLFINLFFCTLGALIAAFALECFLVPNEIIDGGIVGISIMASYLTKVNLGIFLIILNIPFLFMALKEFGKRFVILALYSVGMLALFVNVVQKHIPVITHEPLLVAIFGGGILGVGVGLVLKNDSCMDGTEIMAIKISKKYPYSVGEIIMFINVFIFSTAGFVYNWEKAMYSTLAYLVAYRAIDAVVQGLSEEKSIRIISDKGMELGQAIIEKLNKTVTYIDAQGGYSKAKKTMVYCVIPRIELSKLKEVVASVDNDAFISIENIHEVYGKRYRK
ncbi:MAG: YitT family protein [Candidatus Gastranaerophilales bacterium]|nr:YitT family protein [Candidatus Gastranaerophilales bacterium]